MGMDWGATEFLRERVFSDATADVDGVAQKSHPSEIVKTNPRDGKKTKRKV
jgi:hypothetical protein